MIRAFSFAAFSLLEAIAAALTYPGTGALWFPWWLYAIAAVVFAAFTVYEVRLWWRDGL